VNDYVQILVQLRKSHPAFRLQTAEQIKSLIHFQENLPGGGICYEIEAAKAGDSWKKILVCFNNTEQTVQWTDGENWNPYIINNSRYNAAVVPLKKMQLSAYSCGIYYQD
jgi:pullulanase